jgi:hypothetical protein
MGKGGSAEDAIVARRKELSDIEAAIKSKEADIAMIEKNKELVATREDVDALNNQISVVQQDINQLSIAHQRVEAEISRLEAGGGRSGGDSGSGSGSSGGGSGDSGGRGNSGGESGYSGKGKSSDKDGKSGSGKTPNVTVKSNIMPGAASANSNKSAGAFSTGVIVIFIILAGLAFWVSRIALNDSVYTYLCFIIVFLSMLVYQLVPMPRLRLFLVLLLLAGAGWFAMTYTVPQVIEAFASGRAQEAGEQTIKTAETGTKSVMDEFTRTWQQQKAMASGEYIRGDVDKTVTQSVGIELLDPYMKNPDKVQENEYFEISGRIKAFDPKHSMNIKLACNVRKDEIGSLMKTQTMGAGVELYSGSSQTTEPALIQSSLDRVFEEDVTCYPTEACDGATGGCQPITCGSYRVALTGEADSLRTDASLQNYIMNEDDVLAEVRSYAESNKIENADAETLIRRIHPEIGSYISISDKGSIKVVMETMQTSLIGVSEKRKLKLKIGIENVLDGWVRKLNSVKITIPEYFAPEQGMCTGWDIEGSVLTLRQDKNINLDNLAKGQQKILPSCQLVTVAPASLTSPKLATFLAAVDYNYVVQKRYSIKILNATGGLKCPESVVIS